MPAHWTPDPDRSDASLIAAVRTTMTAVAAPGDDLPIAARLVAALVDGLDVLRADAWRFDGAHPEHVAFAGSAQPACPALPPAAIAQVRDRTCVVQPLDALSASERSTWGELPSMEPASLVVHPIVANSSLLGAVSMVVPSASERDLASALSIIVREVTRTLESSLERLSSERAELLLRLHGRVLHELAHETDVESLRAAVSQLIAELVPGAHATILPIDSVGRLHVPPASRYGDAGWRQATLSELQLLAPVLSSSGPTRCRAGDAPAHPGWHDLGVLDGPADDEQHGQVVWATRLSCADQPSGILVVATNTRQGGVAVPIEERIHTALTLVATPAGLALQHALVEQRDRIHSARLTQLNELATGIGRRGSRAEVLQDLVMGVRALLEYPTVAVFSTEAELLAETGPGSGSLRDSNRIRSLIATAVHRRRPSRIERADTTSHAMPLSCANEIHAVLYVEQPDNVTPEQQADELRLLTSLCDHAAGRLLALHAAEQIERNYKDTIQALVHALEARDRYTADHSDVVSKWALAIGQRLGMDDDELRDLELGAILHDIGKVAIPDSILNKPGRLTDEEFELMKSHTIEGERILQPIGFLRNVAPIVRHEHERWDGRGYPDGIAGDDIPLASRIIFVCDAYHAITSDRPYRSGQPHAFARRIIAENADTQFDPAVVQVFLDVIDQWCDEAGVLDLGEDRGVEINNPIADEPEVAGTDEDEAAA